MASSLNNEDVALGPPANVNPLAIKFGKDQRLVTFLYPNASGTRQIFAIIIDALKISEAEYHHQISKPVQLVDLSKIFAESSLSLQEQLRRERMRLFTAGITSYEWASFQQDSIGLIIPTNGQIFSCSIDPQGERDAALNVVYDGSHGDAIDAHISPSNKAVAFVIERDLYVLDIPEVTSIDRAENICSPVRLTFDGEQSGISCGLADFLAQEEMNRYRGFWWSPDSLSIAFTVVDETMVPEYQILHQGKADPKHSEVHRYPFVGEKNPVVRLAVTSVSEGRSTVYMDLVGPGGVETRAAHSINPDDYYLGRVGWWPDGSVMAQVQNREQSVLQLLRLDPMTGAREVILEESTTAWTNLHDMLHTFSAGWSPRGEDGASASSSSASSEAAAPPGGDFFFIWASERSGFSQLYLYQYRASSKAAVCLLGGQPIGGGGEWVVESIDAVDEKNEVVYFSGNQGFPLERHAFSASFSSTAAGSSAEATAGAASLKKLTAAAGWHDVTVSVETGLFVDLFSSLEHAPKMKVHRIDTGALVDVVLDNKWDTRLTSMADALQTPRVQMIRSLDDKVELYCALYCPRPEVHGPGPYPTIVSVYGGPHVQRVNNQWLVRVDLRAQKLAQDGFLVIKCDNRGSSRRGLSFEGAVKWDMGNLEVSDQQAAVAAFASEGLVDTTRVGMFGWSYGGYMSAMALCRAPQTFACAVAGAPVTSWDGYDTHYTERYMGTPKSNPQGYIDSSVMSHVEKMQGRLLLVHGLIDENVHFRHTARLINALIQHRKRYDLILFPCERHSPHKPQDRVYMEDRISDFFAEQLLRAPPVTAPGDGGGAAAAAAAGSAGGAAAAVVKLTAHL